MTKFFSLLFILIFLKFNFAFAESLVNLSEASWNDIDSMTGQFKQTDHDGNIQYGNFYIQKPHRSLFEYTKCIQTHATTMILFIIINF